MSIAFGLRAEYDNDAFLGGVLAVGDESINVLEELQAGDGVIVVEDHETVKVAVLDDYPPLQRVELPHSTGEQDTTPTTATDAGDDGAAGEPDKPLEDLTVAELRDVAKAHGIETAGLVKSELVAAIAAAETDPNTDGQEG